MRPISWPLKDFVCPAEKSDKPHPLGVRKRSSFSIASAFARSRNPSSKVHNPISLRKEQKRKVDGGGGGAVDGGIREDNKR
uniref:Uncharacterized protein n=1 Tax=Glycine max TaxID=3847 RepID=C6T5P5_SOYBN|nr:unknown [Glycine max]